MTEGEIRDQVARALRSDHGKFLVTKLTERRHMTISSLKTARDLIDIGRYQGNLEIIDWLLKFKED